MTTATCAFCEVVSGRSQAHRVVETSVAVAFLDTRPLFTGHTLVVPRRHASTLPDLPGDLVEPFFVTVQRLVRAVETATRADGSLVLINNVVSQSVPHLHVHVVPRRRGDGLRYWLGPRQRYAHDTEAAQLAAQIRAAYQQLEPGQPGPPGDSPDAERVEDAGSA